MPADSPPRDRVAEPAPAAGDAPRAAGLDREHVVWAYRLLLDREPESEEVIRRYVGGCRDARDLRDAILRSAEFRKRNEIDPARSPEPCVVLKELEGGLRLFLDLSDLAIGLNVARGLFEPNEIAFARQAVRPGDLALDVGANIGVFAMVLAERVGPAGRVHAFEPLEQNAALLERSIAENRFGDRVVLHRAAVGDHDGRAEIVGLDLAKGALNSGGAYLRPAGASVPDEHELHDVPILRLDGIQLDRRVAFVKIDTEGAEPFVMRGARRLLSRDRPAILCEINAEQLGRVAGTDPAAFVREMAELGYRCHRLEGGQAGAIVHGEMPELDLWSAVFLPAS